MPIDFTPYAVPLYAGLLLLVGALLLAWQRRQLPLARQMIWATLAMMVYAGGYAMEISATTLHVARFWLKVQYLTIPSIGTALLLMVLVYTGYDHFVTRRNVALLLVVPGLTTLMAWTNSYHELLWLEITIDRSHGFTGSLFVRAPWYWLMTGYNYLQFMFAIVLLTLTFQRTSGIYRRQIGMFLLAMLVPLTAHVVYLLDGTPPGLDITPYAFIVTATILGISVFYYQVFDALPVAQEIVIASMQDAVIVVDQLNHIIDANPAAHRLAEMPQGALVGRRIEEAFPSALQPIATFALGDALQTELTLPDQRTFDARSQPLHRRPGSSDGYILVLHDITERRRAEQKQLHLIAELDAFAQTVAHDLKNPLTVISSYSLMLQEESRQLPPDAVEEYADTIAQYSQKMVNIIDEILLLATLRKVDTIQLKPLDMAAVVTEAQSRLVTLIAESGAQITAPATWPVALGYAAWVQEIWANYISNAIKYGGDPPRVELGGAAQHDGTVRFWVRDNGAGLTPEEQRQIFTPFIRLHEIRAEGHGLGLSIVDRIVQKLGGRAGVDSTPGQGSTFYFTLPAPPQG